MIRRTLQQSQKKFSSTVTRAPFVYQDIFENAKADPTPYRRLDTLSSGVSTVELGGETFLKIEPEVLTGLTAEAMKDIAHLLRPGHLQQLRKILDDPESSDNDRFVALELLKNANIAASFILPGCQDTGTGIVLGKKGHRVLTEGDDDARLSEGVYETYTSTNLRYSQVAPIDMYTEKNTKTNLPAQVELFATKGEEYKFLFMAKGGGSANKTYLFQQTKALLNEKSLLAFLEEKIQTIGTAACPPYHLAIVVGGLSAEQCLKTVKLASARYLDELHETGNDHARGFRDHEMEQKVLKMTQDLGIGAQFGGKYFCHDVRVIRLPRHGASCPVGIGVSCSADRQIKGKITAKGVFLEELERDPSKYLPDINFSDSETVNINLDEGMDAVRAKLTQYPVKTRVSISGTLVVARDIAHAKMKEVLEETGKLPDYMTKYPVYYAGPAKTPEGYASGSFGPTTAGRMDSYVDLFQSAGGSMVMLAKGNRSAQVTKACQKYGGFYLGSTGGPAANLAYNCIKKVDVLEWPELGMEAVWKIEVEDFPAFIVVDDKGNDFFKSWKM